MGFPRKKVEFAIKSLGGSLAPGGDTPNAEALVSWLLEHQELQIPELSDSDSLSDIEGFSDSDSFSDEFEDLDELDVQVPSYNSWLVW